MIFLLGVRHKAIKLFQREQFFSKTYMCYLAYATSKTKAFKYEINENLLLSEESRERCLEKMRWTPPERTKSKETKRESKKLAAVLIAVCTDENLQNLSLLYTKRSHLLSRHKRQISFPGGIKEDNEDFVDCALRETQEEIGLPPNRFEIWGSGHLIKPSRTAAIMPVIGVVRNFKTNELKLNTAEVEEAFTISIKSLASPQTLHYTQFKSGYSTPVYVVNGKRIWGITGYITNLFLKCFLPPVLNNIQNRVKFIRSFKSKTLP